MKLKMGDGWEGEKQKKGCPYYYYSDYSDPARLRGRREA
jgi:hypothetical protein